MREMTKVTDRLTKNKISPNTSKTKFMLFTNNDVNQDAFKMKVNGISVDRVLRCKQLGVLLDEKLKSGMITLKYKRSHCAISKYVGVMC